MSTLQEMGEKHHTRDCLVPIMLKSADRWDHVAAFVTLTMRRKMERRPIATATQHSMLDLAIFPLPCLPLATQQRKKTILDCLS